MRGACAALCQCRRPLIYRHPDMYPLEGLLSFLFTFSLQSLLLLLLLSLSTSFILLGLSFIIIPFFHLS
jgi:hypothetical protein